MAWRHSAGTVRVSCAALLRIKSDDRYVLFHTPRRPGTFSPPGGVFKYFPPAERLLEGMGFREDRIDLFADDMRFDLRGFIPAAATRDFRRWFASGAYREDTTECLRRELGEELAECGLESLVPYTRQLSFSPVRAVSAGPDAVPGRPYRQLRRFAVCDLVMAHASALRLHAELVDAGTDDAVPSVICVTASDISYGRAAEAMIAAQTAYLIGDSRIHEDIPEMRRKAQ
jgi:SMODS-associated NUDIX domain